MVGGKVANLIQIANKRIVVLNGRIADYQTEMYPVPAEPTADHIRRMIKDLDWLIESVEPETGRDGAVYTKYKDVRARLVQIHSEMNQAEPRKA